MQQLLSSAPPPRSHRKGRHYCSNRLFPWVIKKKIPQSLKKWRLMTHRRLQKTTSSRSSKTNRFKFLFSQTVMLLLLKRRICWSSPWCLLRFISIINSDSSKEFREINVSRKSYRTTSLQPWTTRASVSSTRIFQLSTSISPVSWPRSQTPTSSTTCPIRVSTKTALSTRHSQ